MSVHEKDPVCTTLVTKILSGQPLSVAEKAHLTECAGCMLEVVRQLDQERGRNLPSHGTTGSAGETDAACSAEVIEALEHGRRAFAREFGLS